VVNIENSRVNKNFIMFTNLPIFIRLCLCCANKFVNYFLFLSILTFNFLLTISFSKHKSCRNLSIDVRWTERDLNPRFFDCESNVRTDLNHQPHLDYVCMSFMLIYIFQYIFAVHIIQLKI
jgi:hypothetical protein